MLWPSLPGANDALARALPDTTPPSGATPEARLRWADLRVRIVSASVLAPLALGCAWLGGAAWAVLICMAGAGVAAEWVVLCAGRVWSGAGLSVALPVLAAYVATALGVLAAGVASLIAGAILTRRIMLGAGVLYAGVAGMALIWLRADPAAGRLNVLFLIVAVVSSDVGAYVTGRLVGGPRLAPLISPGKTWSGALGGLAFAAFAGAMVAEWTGAGRSVTAASIAVLLAAVAQGGDLFESWLKRRSGVKDSGWLIPGHGGIMDRLDGFLAAGPAAALIAAFVGRGTLLWH